MKKRNRVLEIILCAALAFVVFWSYLFAARDNGVFALADIEGDRTALNTFSFEGTAGDSYGSLRYFWQDGAWKTKYYAATEDEMRYIVRQERNGNHGISRFFKKKGMQRSEYYAGTEVAPAKDAAVRRLTKPEDVSEQIRENIAGTFEGEYIVRGVAADAVDIYGVVKEYVGGETRFFTGLQRKGGEYRVVEAKQGNMTYETPWLNDKDEVVLCTVKNEDVWYAIPRTGTEETGEVSLFRIPKEGMEEFPYGGEDALYSTKQYGKAEPIKTFSVNAENRIVALEKAGENQLLLARTEQDALLLELYDTEGNLLDRLETGIQNISAYDMDDVNMVQRADSLVLWLSLTKTTQDDADGIRHSELEGKACFAVQKGKIKQLQIESSTEYVDVQEGKILQIEGTASDTFAEAYFGAWNDGYDITVTDAETGALLYHGRLKTDFAEDSNKMLSTINIGRGGKLIRESADAVNWESYNKYNGRQRSVGKVVPLDGKLLYNSWQAGATVYSVPDDIY